jgi:hypothetical protein
VKQDKDDTRLLYGKMVPFEDLLRGRVPAPKDSHNFLATLEKYAPPAPAQRSSVDNSK